MRRRSFIQTLGAVGAASLLPRRAFAAKRLERVGLELYSVRNAMHADPERTLAAIRAIGYTDVELLWTFNNFDRTPQQVLATLKHEGLRAPSAHIAPEEIVDRARWTTHLATAQLLGHQYLIVPSLPDEIKTSLDAWRTWADRFNTAGSVARSAGIWLAFHNDANLLKPIDGVLGYDLFIERLDPSAARLQLDVGNMLMDRGDPMKYLARHRDRYWSFHLKDVVADRSHDTELGTGIFDFKTFLAAVPSIDQKPCYVEQENAKDELASAGQSLGYIKSVNW
jgi:sugar phosphate isomerase/epimerase